MSRQLFGNSEQFKLKAEETLKGICFIIIWMAHIILVDTMTNHFTESVKYNQFQGFDFDTIDEVKRK